MGQEHLVVPSPFTRQICEQPPLSWAQGCCPEKEKKKEKEKAGREEGRKERAAKSKLIIYELPRTPNLKLPWT